MIDQLFQKFSVANSNELTRQLWVKEVLEKIKPGKKILDAGAGEQQYRKYCGHLEYISQDFAKYNGKGNKKGLQTESWDYKHIDIVSDITKIPLKENSIDVILCTEVLEHIPEPILAIKEFSRLLKKGGILIITAPFCSGTHFSPFHYYSGYNIYFYKSILSKYKFRIKKVESNGNFFQYVAQEIKRILPITKLYTDVKVRPWEKFIFLIMLYILRRLDHNDKGSQEFLNFGFHVIAIKK